MNTHIEAITAVGFCPHCGNRAPQELVYTHNYEDAAYGSSGEIDARGMPSSYYVAKCSTCNDLLIYHAMYWEQHVEQLGFTSADLVYPSNFYLHQSVPSGVRASYADAVNVRRVPNAYAVMLRRALESLCIDRGLPTGSLQNRLRLLAEKGEIPSNLAEVTAILRQLGNAGAHNTGKPITVPMTWAMDRFFRAIVEYVYVAPAELERFRASLEQVRSDETPDHKGEAGN
jgi:hypothetical protein